MKVFNSASVAPAAMDHGEGVSVKWLITREQGARNFSMRIIEVQPAGATPFHHHPEEHEVYVLEGSGVVRGVEGETPVAAGDVAYIAPEEQHCFTNTGQSPLRFICVIPLL